MIAHAAAARAASGPPSEMRPFWLSRWLASPHLRWLWLVMLYVVFQPPEKGLGVDLCSVHRTTNAPCPGCGMTRSGANMIRGNFVRAWQFHPFGYLFMPALFALAGLSLLPGAVRGMLAQRAARYERWLRVLNVLVFVAFFLFGIVRFSLVIAGRLSFPP